MNTIYTIYKITNTINGKIYIGQHRTNNIDDGYMGSGNLIKRAFKKYGRHNFTKEILFTYNNFDYMDSKEKELVNEEFVARKDTYNLKCGGKQYNVIKLDNHKQKQANIKRKETRKRYTQERREKLKETLSKSAKDSWYNKSKEERLEIGKLISNRLHKYRKNNEHVARIGYYITPFGKFRTSIEAASESVGRMSSDCIRKYSLNNITITPKIAGWSKYFSKHDVGKPSFELGFGYIFDDPIKDKIHKAENRTILILDKYITPFGTFYSPLEASLHIQAAESTITNFCKNNERKITKSTATKSNIFKYSDIGKTLKELGFSFNESYYLNKTKKSTLSLLSIM